MQQQWKTIKKTYVYKSHHLRIRHDDVQKPDGTTVTYDVVERDDFVCIIPKVGDTFYLVEQYRHPINQTSVAFPQGQIEQGEKPETTAQRELLEETGLVAQRMVLLSRLALGEGHHTQCFSIFLANNCRPGNRTVQNSEEVLQVKIYSFIELKSLVKKGSIVDSPTVAAFCLYMLQ